MIQKSIALYAAALCFVAVLAGCAGKTDSDKTNSTKSPDSKSHAKAAKPKGEPAEPIPLARFPKPAGVEVAATFADTRTIMMRGPNKLAEFQKFYVTELGRQGWKKNAAESEMINGVGFVKLEKGTLSIGITFNPGRDGKSMTIMAQGSGVSVPKESEGDGE